MPRECFIKHWLNLSDYVVAKASFSLTEINCLVFQVILCDMKWMFFLRWQTYLHEHKWFAKKRHNVVLLNKLDNKHSSLQKLKGAIAGHHRSKGRKKFWLYLNYENNIAHTHIYIYIYIQESHTQWCCILYYIFNLFSI